MMITIRKCLGLFHNIARSQHNLTHGRKLNISNSKMNTDIVWIDLEMTGLDIDKDKIIEVACIITDANLEIKSTKFHAIIHETDALIGMDDWCKNTHQKSGLIDAVKNSNITIADAEEQLLRFIRKYVDEEKTCPLAGNSIYVDRMFIQNQMPKVDEYLHHRIIDVSSIKELARRWYPDVFKNAPPKQFTHRAIDDIKASIVELNYYRNNIFKN